MTLAEEADLLSRRQETPVPGITAPAVKTAGMPTWVLLVGGALALWLVMKRK